MAWNLFKKKDKNTDEYAEHTKELEQTINQSLRKAEQDKINAEKMITVIYGWAAEAIIDTYADQFPNGNLSFYRDKYKETALQDYEKIKEEHAAKLNAEVVEKCDKIVSAYLKQAELQQAKVQLYTKLYDEYKATKQKFDIAKIQAAKTDKLRAHGSRISAMNEDPADLSNAYSQSYKLEDLKKEVEIKEAYFDQLDKLNQQYGDSQNLETTSAYKDEIDKLMNEL